MTTVKDCTTDTQCTRKGCGDTTIEGTCQIFDPEDLFGYGTLWMFLGKVVSMLVTFRFEDMFELLVSCWKLRPESLNPYAGEITFDGPPPKEEQENLIYCFPSNSACHVVKLAEHSRTKTTNLRSKRQHV